jgi:hypothetical protein
MKLILITIFICLIIVIIFNNNNEKFIDINSNNIIFYSLNDSIIKTYNINSFYSLYGNELQNLFNNDEIIRVKIPLNYSITISYSYAETSTMGKIIELGNGIYEINKFTSDKIIYRIDIKNMIRYNNNLLAVTNIGFPYYWDIDMKTQYRPEYSITF